MIRKAYIEENGNRQMEPEMEAVHTELVQRNVPVELFTEKRLQRRQLPIANETLVVGYVQTVLTALQNLGIESPSTNDYPSVLQPFFHRKIWESTAAQLIDMIYAGSNPVFAKPKGRRKRFTGHIFKYTKDLKYLEGASGKTPIFCSDIVQWLSEWRIFVIHNDIVGIKHYNGDSALVVDQQTVFQAVQLLEQSRQTTAAYAIDFGVISTGQTALVEWNDGFSLGSYGLDKSLYTDLLIERWLELTS